MLRYSSNQSVSMAFRRLRVGVISCCWIVGLALAAQMVVWSLATFTQLRYEVVEEKAEAPLVVTPEQSRHRSLRNRGEGDIGLPSVVTSNATKEAGKPQTQARLVPSASDARFKRFFMIASGAGTLAAIALIMMVTFGSLLAVASGTHNADRTVSAYIWAVVLAAMVLPLGRMMNLPWQNGALTTYEHLTAAIDHVSPPPDPNPPNVTAALEPESTETEAAAEATMGETLTFYARFGLLPLTCIIGLIIVGVRFNAGVDAAIIPRESMRLDPTLEREASNISPTSLHGGRSAAILSQTLSRPSDDDSEGNGRSSPASLRQLSAGEAPKRLI